MQCSNPEYLKSSLDQLLGLWKLLQQSIADDQGVPQLFFFKDPHGSPHETRAQELLSQLFPEGGLQGKEHSKGMPAFSKCWALQFPW